MLILRKEHVRVRDSLGRPGKQNEMINFFYTFFESFIRHCKKTSDLVLNI